jgi:hypothetical protein
VVVVVVVVEVVVVVVVIVVVDPTGLLMSNVGLDGHEVPRVTHATANDGSVAAGTLRVPGVHTISMLVVCCARLREDVAVGVPAFDVVGVGVGLGIGSDGPGSDGPGSDGPGSDGPGSDGPGSDGPGSDGPGSDGAGSGVRFTSPGGVPAGTSAEACSTVSIWTLSSKIDSSPSEVFSIWLSSVDAPPVLPPVLPPPPPLV